MQNEWEKMLPDIWKIDFWNLSGYSTPLKCIIRKSDSWNCISISYSLLILKKNWGYPCSFLCYNDLKICMFFAYFYTIGPYARARILNFDARLHHYYWSKMTENELKLLRGASTIHFMSKNWIFEFRTCWTRGKRARGRARAEIFEMFKMAWYVLSFS